MLICIIKCYIIYIKIYKFHFLLRYIGDNISNSNNKLNIYNKKILNRNLNLIGNSNLNIKEEFFADKNNRNNYINLTEKFIAMKLKENKSTINILDNTNLPFAINLNNSINISNKNFNRNQINNNNKNINNYTSNINMNISTCSQPSKKKIDDFHTLPYKIIKKNHTNQLKDNKLNNNITNSIKNNNKEYAYVYSNNQKDNDKTNINININKSNDNYNNNNNNYNITLSSNKNSNQNYYQIHTNSSKNTINNNNNSIEKCKKFI
jgi:hypothetical protein